MLIVKNIERWSVKSAVINLKLLKYTRTDKNLDTYISDLQRPTELFLRTGAITKHQPTNESDSPATCILLMIFTIAQQILAEKHDGSNFKFNWFNYLLYNVFKINKNIFKRLKRLV